MSTWTGLTSEPHEADQSHLVLHYSRLEAMKQTVLSSTPSQNVDQPVVLAGTSEICNYFLLMQHLLELIFIDLAVNAPDADLIFRSSDQVVFHIHSKNLEMTTGGFPPIEFAQGNEVPIVDLSENAAVLELLFQFVYPRRQPSLAKLDFNVLAQLSEAVEKYMVYPAQEICASTMSDTLPKHALEILDYSVIHDYVDLSDKAAPYVTVAEMAQGIKTLSPEVVYAWLRYYATWKRELSNIKSYLPSHTVSCNMWHKHWAIVLESVLKFPGVPREEDLDAVMRTSGRYEITCCEEGMRKWKMNFLQRIRGIPAFKDFLTDPQPQELYWEPTRKPSITDDGSFVRKVIAVVSTIIATVPNQPLRRNGCHRLACIPIVGVSDLGHNKAPSAPQMLVGTLLSSFIPFNRSLRITPCTARARRIPAQRRTKSDCKNGGAVPNKDSSPVTWDGRTSEPHEADHSHLAFHYSRLEAMRQTVLSSAPSRNVDQPVVPAGTSGIFNAPDADLLFRSSDDVGFHIHSKNLKTTTGGFPPREFAQGNEVPIIDLPENAAVLELLFQFVYPRRQPSLAKLDFNVLAQLSEAVEKYMVYPAQQICASMMTKTLPKHALEILDYSFKHDYAALSDQAATYVTLAEMAQGVKTVSPEVVHAWWRYYATWKHELDNIKEYSSSHRGNCTVWLTHWANVVESALKFPGVPREEDLNAVMRTGRNDSDCCVKEMQEWNVKFIKRIQGIPAFTQFLTDPQPQVETTLARRRYRFPT
ncbi:hypothetical protein D9615_005820 [Tricholomella constricta]|uniref:BTB domain-containing protein n=1 Tax=Tricholomella constricta TaxID=117010 RepID=A0A8H5M3E7_9AGAR|nr:hypothetical protein D9615_005820 [Tricholomella constricta]